jgi:hypothetical protein
VTQSASADLVERASQVFGVAPPRMGEAPGGRAINWINAPDQEFHVLSSPSGMTVSTRDPGRSDTDDRADAKGPPPSPPRPAPSWDPPTERYFSSLRLLGTRRLTTTTGCV